MTETTIKIKGMHCPSCEVLLTDVLNDEQGVTKASVSLKGGVAEVDFDPKKTSEQKLRKAIEKEGYKTS